MHARCTPAVPTLLALAAAAMPAAAQTRLVVFVHDQSFDTILRMQDLNGDGDAHDPGEVTRFYDDTPVPLIDVENAQGLVAVDPWTVMATDNFAPDNVVMLFDLDRNGDAFGPNEAIVWFDGALPSGLTLTNPAELRRRADGSFFLLDNTLHSSNLAQDLGLMHPPSHSCVTFRRNSRDA